MDQAEGEAVIAALLTLLTVWTSPAGEPTYVFHCRQQPGGCPVFVTGVALHAAAAADAWDLDPALLLAVAFVESGLEPEREGAALERGLWQLHPRGAGKRALRMCHGPGAPQTYCDAFVAAQELHRGLEACGGLRGALRYYNAGHCGEPGRYGDRVEAALEALSDG